MNSLKQKYLFQGYFRVLVLYYLFLYTVFAIIKIKAKIRTFYPLVISDYNTIYTDLLTTFEN